MTGEKYIHIIDIIDETIVDGVGLRTSIYCSGCSHKCRGCHNPESWDLKNGKATPVSEILERVLANEFTDVTFSGGDPFFQAEGFAELARRIKESSRKNIWCYTGWTYELLLRTEPSRNLLANIDVLVDGCYKEDCKTDEALFRGSSNQRLIDVQKSLATGTTVRYEIDN